MDGQMIHLVGGIVSGVGVVLIPMIRNIYWQLHR